MFLHLYLIIACIVAVEIFIRAKVTLRLAAIASITKKTSHVISSAGISDRWKEKVIPAYAMILFRHSASALFAFLAMIALFVCIYSWSPDYGAFLISPLALLESFVLAGLYLKVRLTFRSE